MIRFALTKIGELVKTSWPQLFSGLVAAAASFALGLIVGYLTGQSGPDRTTLLAALLPAVMSAGGLVVFSRLGSDGGLAANILPSVGVLIFSIGLYYGVNYGEQERKNGADKAANISLQLEFLLQEHRLRLLQTCAIHEYELNQGRQALGLRSLPPDTVCKVLSP